MRLNVSVIFLFIFGLLGCSSVIPFEVESETYSFEIVPTGIAVSEFWAERGQEITTDLNGITLKQLTFYFTITNQIGSDTVLNVVWALSGSAGNGETKVYVGTPEVISSGKEGVDYVYLAKNVNLTNNQSTSFSVIVDSKEFLDGLVDKKKYWILLKNNISGPILSSSKQKGIFKVVIKGEKSLF